MLVKKKIITIVIIFLLGTFLNGKGLIRYRQSVKKYEKKLKESEKQKIKRIVRSLMRKNKFQKSNFAEANLLRLMKSTFPNDTAKIFNKRMFYLTYLLSSKLNKKKLNMERKKLGPQPEPPEKNKAKNKFIKPGTAEGFTPQPEPPGKTKVTKLMKPNTKKKKKKGFVNPAVLKGFNPQPEPPALQRHLKPSKKRIGVDVSKRMGIVIIELNAIVDKYHKKTQF